MNEKDLQILSASIINLSNQITSLQKDILECQTKISDIDYKVNYLIHNSKYE